MPHQALFNVFSHNSKIGANGYNEEENKMVNETRKIFHCPEIRVTATCVRVPVLRAHSEAINIEFSQPDDASSRSATMLAKAPGVRIVDDRQKNYFPMPLDATGQDDVLVGRIRQDIPAWTAGRHRHVRQRRPDPQGRGPERRPDRRDALTVWPQQASQAVR